MCFCCFTQGPPGEPGPMGPPGPIGDAGDLVRHKHTLTHTRCDRQARDGYYTLVCLLSLGSRGPTGTCRGRWDSWTSREPADAAGVCQIYTQTYREACFDVC